ncbi:hypothetical protein niasHT_019823 [Heterodera trifolii]|uniref:Uncharacterized protein n=1 Tax=Heterodera trifolii TaxID=157864 RepID=A0ABD2KUS2_9BILA
MSRSEEEEEEEEEDDDDDLSIRPGGTLGYGGNVWGEEAGDICGHSPSRPSGRRMVNGSGGRPAHCCRSAAAAAHRRSAILFVRRYLSRSDLLHLHRRVVRARSNGATIAQIRRVVWHFLSQALSPEQKTELGMQMQQLRMDFE